jgi:hypothetical protein
VPRAGFDCQLCPAVLVKTLTARGQRFHLSRKHSMTFASFPLIAILIKACARPSHF